MTIDTITPAAVSRSADRTPVSSDAAVAQGASRAPATAVETANAVKANAAVPTLDQVNEAVSQLNKSAQANAQGLEFSVDTDTKRTVVKVIDQSTKEVLRQIPSPEALEIAKSLEAKSHAGTGLLIQQTA